jgi:hypothetical protein
MNLRTFLATSLLLAGGITACGGSEASTASQPVEVREVEVTVVVTVVVTATPEPVTPTPIPPTEVPEPTSPPKVLVPTSTPAPTSTPVPDYVPVGEAVQLGDWSVRVLDASIDNGATPYEPIAGVEYVGIKVVIEGTYSGEDEGFLDLHTVKYHGSDFVVYSDLTTSAFPGFQSPQKVIAGGTTVWEAGVAVPVGAVQNEWVIIERLFSFDEPTKFAIPPLE